MKLLLHACCGPCSLEPIRLLRTAGHDITIAFMNDNIHPADEYTHRLDTLRAWALDEGIPVVEGAYEPLRWEEHVGTITADPARSRSERCRSCYRLRLDETARYAVANGFEGIGTTLTVSPYQYTAVICEELEAVATAYGLRAVYEDFRDHFEEATRRSRMLGMYRQNYCGCRISEAEAADERKERKSARSEAKRIERIANAGQRAAAEAILEAKRVEKQEYTAKRTAQRKALKALREASRTTSKEETDNL